MKIILYIILFLYTAAFHSQIEINLEPTQAKEIRKYEESIDSKSKGFETFNPYGEKMLDVLQYWPNVTKRALIFKRKDDSFYPTLHSWYFFDDKDSIAKIIYYNWGFANTAVEATNQKIISLKNKQSEFVEKYKAEKKNLIGLVGNPNINDEKEDNESYLNLKSIWYTKNHKILLEMTFDKRFNSFEFNSKNIILPRTKVVIEIMFKNHAE